MKASFCWHSLLSISVRNCLTLSTWQKWSVKTRLDAMLQFTKEFSKLEFDLCTHSCAILLTNHLAWQKVAHNTRTALEKYFYLVYLKLVFGSDFKIQMTVFSKRHLVSTSLSLSFHFISRPIKERDARLFIVQSTRVEHCKISWLNLSSIQTTCREW